MNDELEDAVDPADFVLNEQRRATGYAVTSLDDDPEKAVRAQQLSDATGFHPAVVYGDLEHYEEQHKAQLTNQLLSNNDYLREYVDSHPLAAKISNDDYGQLDAASSAISKFIGGNVDKSLSVLEAGAKGFKEGFDAEGLQSDYRNLYNYIDSPLWHGLVHNAGFGGVALTLEGSMRAFTGLVQGASAMFGESYIQHGGNPAWADRLTRDLIIGAQVALSGQAGIHGAIHPEIEAQFHKISEAARVVKPYVDAGVEPPVGVHPLIDKAKVEQSKLDLDNLDDALKESQASQTRERSPELYANFVKQHVGDRTIGISADAVREMYGDKVPNAEDGKLGFVPNLAEQLRLAQETGGDIEVPLSDWLARVEPNVAKELHDHIRVRDSGLTVEEGKNLPKIEGPETALAPLTEEQQPVQSVRDGAALQPLFDRDISKEDLEAFFGGTEREFSPIARGVVPSELELEPHEVEVMNKVNAVLDRIVPQGVKAVGTRDLTVNDKTVKGIYQQYTDRAPLIAYAINPETSVITARHEAIHHLRQQGFFTPEEWRTLQNAATEGKWLDKHNIRERYGDLDGAALFEEAIADEYARWEKAPDPNLPHSAIFQKMKEIFDKIRDGLKEAFGYLPKAEELFAKIESGEIGAREGTGPLHPQAFKAEELSLEETKEKALFDKAKSVGMTADQYKRYMKLIDKRNAEDTTQQLKKAQEAERIKQTKEWKDNYKRVEDEVKNDLTQRPDIAAATFFTEGRIQDAKLNRRPTLAADRLSEEQKAALPKELVSKNGIDPDDIAGHFGYQSGDTMVNRLIALEQARGDVPFADYIKEQVTAETDRRMQQQYGKLDENILAEAKDHVISSTQMDLLHEETVALGMQAGSAMPFTKADFKSWVQDRFAEIRTTAASTDKFLREAGKAGRDAEMALLKGDPAEAFKNKQRQYLSMLLANETKGYEKARDKFDNAAKRFSKREVSGVASEYTNFIRDALQRTNSLKGIHDIESQARKDGYTSFQAFVDSKEAALRDLHVPEWLTDMGDFAEKTNQRLSIDEMTTQQFMELHDAITAMTHNGREELKIDRAGEKEDLRDVIKEMTDSMATLPAYDLKVDRAKNRLSKWLKTYGWSGITVESMLNRLDRDNARGVFNQTIVKQFTSASNYKDKLIREFQKKMSEVGNIKDMDKKVDNDLFVDPHTDQPLVLRRRNVLGILQSVGNDSNMQKLAGGYGVKPEQVMQWLEKNTTKEDWDRAQKIGDIFNELFNQADVMSHNVSGVGIAKIPLKEIDTPFGKYAGWYNPIRYDTERPGESKKLIGKDPLEGEGYYKATTPQGYTKGRTGYIAPVELNLDVVPQRMKQMIHDIAMRPAVLEMSKVFRDPEFNRNSMKHLGPIRTKEFNSFLNDVAQSANFQSNMAATASEALEFFRQNTIATLIGFNPGTVMKHGTTALVNSMTEVGITNFAKEMAGVIGQAPGEHANWKLAMDKSEELQRRMRNFQELISGHGSEINIRGAGSKFDSYREFAMSAGATPVSISDLLSATPTWLAKYKEEIANGSNEGDAVFMADRAVRRAHGSSVLSNKPAIMRTNALGATFSSLYGFFSHMQQKQYELAWKARDTIKGETETKMQHIPDLVRGLFSYVIAPAVIEELVTPYTNEEKDSWGMKAVKTLALNFSSSLIGVRDFVHGLINVRNPQAGLVGTSLEAIADIAKDVGRGKQAMSKERAGDVLKHTFALTGVLTGLTNKTEGDIAQYLQRYFTGQEHPKGPWDVGVGVRFGKTDKHSHSFEQWSKGLLHTR